MPDPDDLARRLAAAGALRFDRDGSPDGLEPEVLMEDGAPFLRLAVRRGAYGLARRGEPDRCDRCELRGDGFPVGTETWHGFALRVAPGFPRLAARFVAAQVKIAGDLSPVVAIRVENARMLVDFRVPGATVALHQACPESGWTDIVLGLIGDRVEVWVDSRHVASARAAFAAMGPTRYLKLGPYRDKHPAWGDGPAAIDVRHIRRGASRAAVLPGLALAA